jgi:dUTP pyrophosphatase
MLNEIIFARIKPGAVIPTKRAEDAAMDVYACFDAPHVIVEPNHTVNIPTGIISAFPSNVAAILKERGSTGSKGIGLRCGVIDSGYRGEWFVTITNHGTKDVIISKTPIMESERFVYHPYDKAIAQVIFLPVAQIEAKEVSVDAVMDVDSERGCGKLGSSSK